MHHLACKGTAGVAFLVKKRWLAGLLSHRPLRGRSTTPAERLVRWMSLGPGLRAETTILPSCDSLGSQILSESDVVLSGKPPVCSLSEVTHCHAACAVSLQRARGHPHACLLLP